MTARIPWINNARRRETTDRPGLHATHHNACMHTSWPACRCSHNPSWFRGPCHSTTPKYHPAAGYPHQPCRGNQSRTSQSISWVRTVLLVTYNLVWKCHSLERSTEMLSVNTRWNVYIQDIHSRKDQTVSNFYRK